MSEIAGCIMPFDGAYQEALALVRDARDYVAHQEREDKIRLSPHDQLVASCESLRVTARLTQVMAWLLVQKAVQAGELTREEAAAPENRLGGHAVCDYADALNSNVSLPPRLEELRRRSGELYRRICRLDALLDH